MFSKIPKKLQRYFFSALLGLFFVVLLSSSSVFMTLHVSQPVTACDSNPCIVHVVTHDIIPGTIPYRPHFTDTWNNIHTFLTFDNNIAKPGTVAQRYDFVWGALMDHVAALRSGNPNIFLSYYIPFNRDPDAGHDLTYWKSIHPDWILYQCNRVTPAYEFGDPNMPLDFSNPTVISWQIKIYGLLASQKGYNGIAADNVTLENNYGACGSYIDGKWVQRYSGQQQDPRWSQDVISWLAHIQGALHSLPHPLALIPNFSTDQSPDSPIIQQVVNHVDGMLDEAGFTHSGDGYLTGDAWVQHMQLIEYVQRQHKPYYIINQFHSISSADIQWALASYLMSKEHTAALFISPIQGYGLDTWYNEYSVWIGSPTAPMYQAQNVYWRNYSNGLSIANPDETATYVIRLPANNHYLDLYGKPVGTTVTMPPHTGIVLLTS